MSFDDAALATLEHALREEPYARQPYAAGVVLTARAEIARLRDALDAALQTPSGTLYADTVRKMHAAESRADAAEAREAGYVAALTRLRDCDWTIGPGDRMDPVREIARKALAGAPRVVATVDVEPGTDTVKLPIEVLFGRCKCIVIAADAAEGSGA